RGPLMTDYLTALVGAVLVLALMLELLRRRQLKEKYAALWLVVGLGVVVLLVAPGLLTTVSEALGFEVPSNFLFFIALTLLLGVTVHLSWEVSRVEEKTRELAEEIAIVNMRLDEVVAAAAEDRDRTVAGRDQPS
ncbi:MAG: DUF2304 domain-containing protein, partial [Ilumatobacteraceae bacterium]